MEFTAEHLEQMIRDGERTRANTHRLDGINGQIAAVRKDMNDGFEKLTEDIHTLALDSTGSRVRLGIMVAIASTVAVMLGSGVVTLAVYLITNGGTP